MVDDHAVGDTEAHLSERLDPFERAAPYFIRALFACVAHVRVMGIENVPRTGPLIVIANHTSNADPPIVGGWLQPALGRPIHFMAKEQLFHSPLAPLVRRYGAIMVRAGGSDVEAYREARAVLQRGGVLGLFPEGTRSTTGALLEAHQGVTLLAARSGALVLPVGIDGTDRLIAPGSSRPHLGARIRVRIGEPFTVTLARSRGRRGATAAATDRLMGHLAALLPEHRRGRYAPLDASAPDPAPAAAPTPALEEAPPGALRALASWSGEGVAGGRE
jgi:1-acyl-sn-glycerol-3-phosphate acyltransferase